MPRFVSALSPALASARSGFFRRPDAWVGLFAAALAGVIVVATDVSVRSLSQFASDHLADSFGVGFLSVVTAVFVEHLLRLTPAPLRRSLRLAWLGAIAASTAGLLATYAPPTASGPPWILQALVLATLAISTLLTLLLVGSGLVRGRELGQTAFAILRHWGAIFFYLLVVGYLLEAVNRASPAVIDPLLLRMDVSLGFNASELIRPWILAHPWLNVATSYGYPCLGLFLALTAACLHLAGATAELRRCLFAYLLVGLLGPVCYLWAPAIGPTFAFPELVAGAAHFPGGPSAFDTFRQALLTGPERLVPSPGVPRNVMPSLHAAFTFVALAAAWSHRRRLFWFFLPLGFVQIATTLTLAVHYVVDLVAAVPFAVLCWSLADAALRRYPPSRTAPLPPLAAAPAGLTSARSLGLALATALGALVLWGRFAPLPPIVAWSLVALLTALPAWLCLRRHTQLHPGHRTPALPSATSTSPAPVDARRLLACAVFCTGGTALILEQVAEKYLTTLLGSSRPAATIVLAVYFTGLALGAWLCPKQTAGASRRLALLELFIAAWAVLLATAFFAADHALGAWLAAADTSAASLTATRLAVAVLWLLPPTLAMGAQLPTLAAVLAGQTASPASTLPRYYALNLAGAATFTLVAPPLLFNAVGAHGALWFVALLGLFVALVLWSGLPAANSDAPPPVSPPAHRTLDPRSLALGPSAAAVAAAFLAGFAFFTLEVVWFHLISAVCGASTYSFSLLLAAILLALALAGHRVARSAPVSLPATVGALCLTLALSNAAWPWAGRVMAALRSALHLEWFWSGELLKFAVISVLVVPPAYFLGQFFPLLLRRAAIASVQVGQLTAANVLGCIAGALTTGFALIPLLGAEHTLLALALLGIAAALLLAWREFRRSTSDGRRSALLPLTAGAFVLALPAWDRLELTRGFGVYLAPSFAPSATLTSFHEDFRAGFVTVTSTPSTDPLRSAPTKTLLQNGKFDADDANEVPAQISFGLIAAVHAPAQNRALVIGAGSGQTASVIARLGFAHLDVAELSPAHLAAARAHFSALNHDVFARPDVTVHIEDGRNHLLRTRARYDLIQIELTSVWFAGATNLYSQEFYALARARLAPGGVLVQWIQLHHLTPREIASILVTARTEFPGVAVWRAGSHGCLVGFTAQPRFNPAVWRAWRTSPALAAERSHPALADLDLPVAFLRQEILSTSRVNALLNRHAGAIGLNTDRNRWLEFQTPKYYLSSRDHAAENLRWLTSFR